MTKEPFFLGKWDVSVFAFKLLFDAFIMVYYGCI